MKKFVIVLLVLIVIGLGALIFAVSRAGSIIEGYKPELERLASESLGSTVTLGNLSVSVFPSALVVIDSANVADVDDPEKTIAIEQVNLDLELIPLLTGKISITTLDVIGPSITVLHEEDGIFIEGLPRGASEAASGGDAAESTETPTDIEMTIDLQSFALRNATLIWKNKIADEEYTVKELDLDASFQFADDRAVFSDVDGGGVFMETIEFTYGGDELRYGLKDGVIGLDQLSASALGSSLNVAGELSQSDSDKTITITSDGLVLDQMQPFFEIFAPAAIEFGLKGTLKPDVQFAFTPTGYQSSGSITVSGLAAGIEDLIGFDNMGGSFSLEATEAKQSVKAGNLAGTLNGAPFEVNMAAALNPTTGRLDPFVMNAFGGEASLTTGLKLDDPTYPFTSELKSGGMLIEELVPALAPDMPIAIMGTVKELSGKIGGMLDENMMPSLTGQIRVLMGDGLIKDVNLGQEVLGSVTNLPFIGGALLGMVPSGLRNFLADDHTVLHEVSGSFTLAKELLTSSDMKIVSDFFMLDAVGTIGLDTNLNLDSVIHFDKDFSADMVDQVKELRGLLDNQGRMSFPVKITGIPPDITTTPDISGILKDVAKGVVRNEVEDMIKEEIGDEIGEQLLNNLVEESDSGSAKSSDGESSLKESLVGGFKSLLGGNKKKKN
ncbi:MAG: AsmA family protein [Candidatus Hydrogenedentota bacterium]